MTDQENSTKVEGAAKGVAPDGRSEDPRRGHKRRNQPIWAIAGGIAVFLVAASILISVAALNSGETSVVPAGDVAEPAVTESTFTQPGTGGHLEPGESLPTETAPASKEADVVRQEQCTGDARSRMELTSVRAGSRIWVRYEVHRSPVGHEWLVAIRPLGVAGPHPGPPFFRGIRVAGDSGNFAIRVQHGASLPSFPSPFGATAVDRQTGQVCRVEASVPWGGR
jgi:hypothetical protein